MASTQFIPQRFTLTVRDGDAVVETYAGSGAGRAHPRYYARDDVVNGVSRYVTVADAPPPRRRCR